MTGPPPVGSAGHSDTGQRMGVVLRHQLVSSGTSLVGPCAQHINLPELQALCLVVLLTLPDSVSLCTPGNDRATMFFLKRHSCGNCDHYKNGGVTCPFGHECCGFLPDGAGLYCGRLQHSALRFGSPEPVSPLNGTLQPFSGVAGLNWQSLLCPVRALETCLRQTQAISLSVRLDSLEEHLACVGHGILTIPQRPWLSEDQPWLGVSWFAASLASCRLLSWTGLCIRWNQQCLGCVLHLGHKLFGWFCCLAEPAAPRLCLAPRP